ncbi:SIR2 family protein (plasmid) [Aquicoccus sp. G2-2]|uniref:SIR2 family protein n=1 Tax=Aquicoccus sp. G2-2 TaxID=3092120 RepID=UPI002ADFF5CA|nr:SIR2 family protein [Aquicoccus sp. G2-2]MEA1112023.1 SIR2 family protein [Aquicoccus sp. G2-2]
MIWEFKQQLYVSQRRVSLQTVADLSNPAVRSRLQDFVTSQESFPGLDTPEEYAALFEAVYPSEADRRTYIDAKISGAKPSYGHVALAALMKAGHTKLVWSTNFDPLVVDGCARVFGGTGNLTTVALDAPDLGRQTINSERWPAEIKLHGDFRSRRLKNTGDELRQQDATLRDLLVGACTRSGMLIAGYSGRDDSIMSALEEALEHVSPFPGGLFWLHRGADAPLDRVCSFLEEAAEKGVDGGLVRIENFDEALRDLIRLVPNLDTAQLDEFASERAVVSSPPRITGNRGYPVVRLNGLEVTSVPTICRRVECDIGGFKEVLEAISAAEVDVLATRSAKGVLAFGADSDVRAALSGVSITEFDLHEIETRRLRYDSQERGLLKQALSAALAREHGLSLKRRRSVDYLSPTDPADPKWAPLKRIVGNLSGSVPRQTDLTWREGIAVRLEWANDKLWLAFEPRTLIDGVVEENRAAATDFSRERSVKRYNRQLNDLISFWSDLLTADGKEMRALNVSTGVDAAFCLGTTTAFSRRSRP